MEPAKKIQKKLEARQSGHREIYARNANVIGFKPSAYKIPGSRNPNK